MIRPPDAARAARDELGIASYLNAHELSTVRYLGVEVDAPEIADKVDPEVVGQSCRP
jgi:hypothetical protein